MAEAKKKNPTIVSPKLEVKYSHLVKPNTKFNAKGEFQLTGVLDPANPDHVKFMAELDTLANAGKATKVEQNKKYAKFDLHLPYRNEEDKEGNETGKIVISFKNGASFEYKGKTVQTRIDIVDAAGNKMVNPKVGSGSIVKVAFNAVPYAMDSTKKAGVSLRFFAVRVLKYVPFTSNAAAVFGGAEEGFVYDGDPGEDAGDTGATGVNDTAPEGGSGDGDY